MWNAVKDDAATNSMLYLLDTKDQLTSMKLSDNDDPKTHLAEMKLEVTYSSCNLACAKWVIFLWQLSMGPFW